PGLSGGGDLTISASSTFTAGTSVNIYSFTLDGPGVLTNNGTLSLGNSTVNAPLVNRGTLTIYSNNASTVNGGLTNAAGGLLQITSTDAEAPVLALGCDAVNDGTIALAA